MTMSFFNPWSLEVQLVHPCSAGLCPTTGSEALHIDERQQARVNLHQIPLRGHDLQDNEVRT